MNRIYVDNLGIKPLAGVCSYEEACKPGYGVETNVKLLRRYNYVKTRLNEVFTAHMASTPEWEVKCAMSLHLYLEAEHASAVRKRITEMREPPLHLDKVPDDKLKLLFDEVIRSENTIELLTGIYLVVKPEMVRSLKKHLEETNPLADYPTCRILKLILQEEEEMIEWGQHALKAVILNQDDQLISQQWQKHLAAYLQDANGIYGDLERPEEVLPAPRSDGSRYQMDTRIKRDRRFDNSLNPAIVAETFYNDERPYDERTFALIYKRLHEIDVPEWMAPILYKTEGKPWEYYADMSRQLWDEARHAMMGEVGLYQDGMPFYKYPVIFGTSIVLNKFFEPIETHIILWALEQSLMHKDTGKWKEWNVADVAENSLAALYQDYDWADEVLHAQIGRKWLIPEVGGMKKLQEMSRPLLDKMRDLKTEWEDWEHQEEWWPQFVEKMRALRSEKK